MVTKVVGLTGGIGSGKSAVADLFAGLGVAVVDADKVSHALTGPAGEAMDRITQRFGEQFLLPDGSLNRPAMRALIFTDAAARLALEDLLHPLIRLRCTEAIGRAHGCYALLVVPLLFESPFYSVVSRTLLVDCEESLQISRVMQRSGLSRQEVEAIMQTQMSRSEKRGLADDLIENNGTLDTLRLQVEEKHRYYHAIFS